MRLCREKIRRAKGQRQHNLAAAAKHSKEHFYKGVSNNRRTKEHLHPSLDAWKHSDKG